MNYRKIYENLNKATVKNKSNSLVRTDRNHHESTVNSTAVGRPLLDERSAKTVYL